VSPLTTTKEAAMSDDFALPDGWTEEDVRRYLKPHDSSGTYALDEDVQTIDVTDIEDDGVA